MCADVRGVASGGGGGTAPLGAIQLGNLLDELEREVPEANLRTSSNLSRWLVGKRGTAVGSLLSTWRPAELSDLRAGTASKG